MTTEAMLEDQLKSELAKIQDHFSTSIAAGLEPLQEEINRAGTNIQALQSAVRDVKRDSLINTTRRNATTVPGGLYDGFDIHDLQIVKAIMNTQPGGDQYHGSRDPDEDELRAMGQWTEHFKAAMDSVSAADWIPTRERGVVWRDVHLDTPIFGLFTNFNMPSATWDMPLEPGDMNFYPGTANVAPPDTDMDPTKRTLTAKELVGMVNLSYDVTEESIIPAIPNLRSTIIRNTREILDDIVLNGDTTVTNNINADGATINSTTVGKAHWLVGFDGLRHYCLVDVTAQGNDHNAAVSDDMFNEIRMKVGKYGVNPARTAFIMDINTFIRSQGISNFRTIDKFGPMATLLTGQLAAIEAIPVIVSEQMRPADTDGKVTSAGNGTNTGSVLIVNRDQWVTGFVRGVTVETERSPTKRQNSLIASFKVALKNQSASAAHTALQYDITGVS